MVDQIMTYQRGEGPADWEAAARVQKNGWDALADAVKSIAERERCIAEAVRSGIPCKGNACDGDCGICGTGPCSGGPRDL